MSELNEEPFIDMEYTSENIHEAYEILEDCVLRRILEEVEEEVEE